LELLIPALDNVLRIIASGFSESLWLLLPNRVDRSELWVWPVLVLEVPLELLLSLELPSESVEDE